MFYYSVCDNNDSRRDQYASEPRLMGLQVLTPFITGITAPRCWCDGVGLRPTGGDGVGVVGGGDSG